MQILITHRNTKPIKTWATTMYAIAQAMMGLIWYLIYAIIIRSYVEIPFINCTWILGKSNQHFHLCWVVLFFFISFYYIHLQTSLLHYSLPGSFHIHCENFFVKVRLLLDYSDLHKNLSKIAILWSYSSHKFSPIPIKLLLLFVEIDHHIQYLWYMQVVTSFPWMICLKQVVSSHQKNVYHFNGLVDNPLCKPIKFILEKNDISYRIPLSFQNRSVNIPISRWYEQWWYNS